MSVADKIKTKCCGCNACAEICPKHCITMIKDYKGFYYPKINKAQCIECNLCKKICPFEPNNINLRTPQIAYAAWSKNPKIHKSSASGGIGYELSAYILKNKGIVYGCASIGLNIKHIHINKLEDLYQLQGSKYIQSDIRGLLSEIKTNLKKNVPILFIGTPCQIAAVKNYIRYIPDNLYLIDLICHGVPSHKMFMSHIKPILKNRNIEKVSFRKGNEYILSLSGKDINYNIPMWKNYFLRSFIQGIICRDSCYFCPFATSSRIGDITIGDFWGLNNIEKEINLNNGVSLVLPCTEKGTYLLNSIKNNINMFERPISEAIKGNSQLQRPPVQNTKSRHFSLLFYFTSFNTAIAFIDSELKIKHKFKSLVEKIMTPLKLKK